MQTPKTVQQMCDFLRLRKQRQSVKLSHIRAQPPHKNGEGRNTLRQKTLPIWLCAGPKPCKGFGIRRMIPWNLDKTGTSPAVSALGIMRYCPNNLFLLSNSALFLFFINTYQIVWACEDETPSFFIMFFQLYLKFKKSVSKLKARFKAACYTIINKSGNGEGERKWKKHQRQWL